MSLYLLSGFLIQLKVILRERGYTGVHFLVAHVPSSYTWHGSLFSVHVYSQCVVQCVREQLTPPPLTSLFPSTEQCVLSVYLEETDFGAADSLSVMVLAKPRALLDTLQG